MRRRALSSANRVRRYFWACARPLGAVLLHLSFLYVPCYRSGANARQRIGQITGKRGGFMELRIAKGPAEELLRLNMSKQSQHF